MSLINPRLQSPASVQIRQVESGKSPIVVDLLPFGGTDVLDHFINDYEIVELRDTYYSSINNIKYYAMRGEYDGVGLPPINKNTKISLYTRLPASGVFPSDLSSVNGITTTSVGFPATPLGSYYNTGSVYSFNKQEYSYEYDVPSNVLRLLDVKEVYTGDEYRLQRRSSNATGGLDKVLLCNVGDMVTIEFVEDVTLGNYEIDPSFLECLSLKIALKLSETLLKTAVVTKEIFDEYVIALSQAKSIDAQESSPVTDFNSTWAEEMRRAT
jgi:hypothetical protein